MTDPRSFLPLTPLALQVLLALADTDRHGYGIIREVADRTDGVITLRTGTLYTLLQRLTDEALIAPGQTPAVPGDTHPPLERDDPRRKYYALTELGRDVLAAEVRRLESVLNDARRKRVAPRV